MSLMKSIANISSKIQQQQLVAALAGSGVEPGQQGHSTIHQLSTLQTEQSLKIILRG